MTLRQLLNTVSFDRLITFIKQSDQPDDVCHYKQAYDILLHTAAEEDGCLDIEVSKREDNDGTKYISASHIEGCSWSRYIDGEVILGEGIDVPDEELAFKILWHLTFYGYSQEESTATFEEMGNDDFRDTEYGLMARAIEHKRYMLWANKEIKKRIRESIHWYAEQGMTSFGLSEEDWRYLDKREKHCNRMKRMRDHRLEKRQEHLANLDRCEHTVQRLLMGQSFTHINRKDLAFLFESKQRIGTEFQTRAYDAAKRLEYLKELVSKYEALTIAEPMNRTAIKISTSSESPLTNEEEEYITKIITELCGMQNPIVIKSLQESLVSEIGLMAVGTR